MNHIKGEQSSQYTCNEYRQEMILAGLQKRLATAALTDDEKKELIREIEKLEQDMGL